MNPAHLQVSVDCVIFGYDDDGLKVLLIEQRAPEAAQAAPNMSIQHALPGDLILEDESLDDAAQRVLFSRHRSWCFMTWKMERWAWPSTPGS